MIRLSVLIATLPERAHLLKRCLESIGTDPEVEILTDDRGRHITTGEKRNALMDRAQGTHMVYFDDDDIAMNGYLHHILCNIRERDPDCVTFRGLIETNGRDRVEWVIKLGEEYEPRTDPDGITRYYRWPNHISVMRTNLARLVRFQHITLGEDFRWSEEIMKRGILKTEAHIPIQLYFYEYNSRK